MSTSRRQMLKGLVTLPIITAGTDLLATSILPRDFTPQTSIGDQYIRIVNQYLEGRGLDKLNPSEERKLRKVIHEIDTNPAPELKENKSTALAVAAATAVSVLRDFKC